MGMWFARHLKNEGHKVIIAGRNTTKLATASEQLGVEASSNHDAVSSADAVILSLPIDGFTDAVEDIAPFTRPGQTVFDVTSIKSKPVEVMHKFLGKCTILGVHPMFGPGADGLAGQRFVLTPTNAVENALADKVKGYLEKRRGRVEIMTPQEHDDVISIVLGLSHFIALVTADTLMQTGKLDKAAAVSGTTFKLIMTLAGSVLSEDPSLYASLQMNLPDSEKLQDLLSSTLQQWKDTISRHDRAAFIERMSLLKEAFSSADPHFKQAYGDMYRLID